jgi:hypothetical protein
LLIERFLEKVDRTLLHRADHERNGCVRREKNKWEDCALGQEPALNLQAADICNPYLQNQATRSAKIIPV